MKLIVKCPACRHENIAPHQVNYRIDYAKRYGENFPLSCKSCNETTEFHVDDIKAIDYSLVEIIKNRIFVFAITWVVTFVLGFFLVGILGGIVLSLIFTIISMFLVKRNNSKQNLIFNKYKLKGRVSGVDFKKLGVEK